MIELFNSTFSEADWSDFLSKELGQAVVVKFGRARKTVLSWKRAGREPIELQMSSFFEKAPAEVRASVATWLRSGRRARNAMSFLDRWIEDQLNQLALSEPVRVRAQPRGNEYDLEQVAVPLWSNFFPELATTPNRPALTWGQSSGHSRRRRSLRFGSYDERSNLVRIHPVLDQAFVPEWFVRYILFHELLHAQLGFQRGKLRRIVHGPEFRRREREYPDYAKAIVWEKQNIRRLLRDSQRGGFASRRGHDSIVFPFFGII